MRPTGREADEDDGSGEHQRRDGWGRSHRDGTELLEQEDAAKASQRQSRPEPSRSQVVSGQEWCRVLRPMRILGAFRVRRRHLGALLDRG